MYPALPDGSAVLTDYLRKTLIEHCIYLYRANNTLLVKRARQCPSGAGGGAATTQWVRRPRGRITTKS